MHRRPEAELLPLDTKLERTLRNLKKVRKVEATVMVEKEEINHNEPVVVSKRPHGQRTMEDFWRPIIKDKDTTVRQPTIEANNFELKPTLITMVQ